MRSISGIYTTSRKKTKKYSIELPGTWEELTPGQFGTAIYLLRVTTKADPDWIRLSLLTLLFQKHWPVLEGVSPDDRQTLLEELTKFFYETEPPLKNFFPHLKELHFIGPDTDLNNISFGEWCFLDTYFKYYIQFKDIKWIIRMIATVYRPLDPEAAPQNSTKYTGDLREEFNENLILNRVPAIEALPEKVRMAIFQWLLLALEMVKEQRAEFFPRIQLPLDEDGNPFQPEQSGDSGEGGNWIDIFNDLIGPKFGTPDQLKKTNAMLVLDYLNKEQKNYKAMKL